MREEGQKVVDIRVDVTKIVQYVCITGAAIVAIIFGSKCIQSRKKQ